MKEHCGFYVRNILIRAFIFLLQLPEMISLGAPIAAMSLPALMAFGRDIRREHLWRRESCTNSIYQAYWLATVRNGCLNFCAMGTIV
jgi:hypothetical protein